MSSQSVKQLIGHALIEPEFRQLLFTDPAQALKGYELTEAEKNLFKDMPREKFESLAGELGERISRAGVVISHHGNEPGTLK